MDMGIKNITGKITVSFKLLPLILCSLLYGCGGGSSSEKPATVETISEVTSINETETTTTNTITDTPSNTETETTVELEPLPENEPKIDNIISVLFVFSSEFSAQYGEDTDLRLQQLINASNQAFQDSTLSVEFTLAGSAEVEFDQLKTDNEALTAISCNLDLVARNKGCVRGEDFNFVSSLREQTKADIITFVRPYHSSRSNQCGSGWVTGAGYEGDLSHPLWKETTVNVVSVDGPCTEWTFAHEIGHNLGLNHGAAQDATGGSFPWAWGYGEYDNFSTIMTYRYLYGSYAQAIYRFSNPDQVCRDSMCGISKNESNGADAVSSLKIIIPQVAAFQQSEEPEKIDADPVVLNDIYTL